MSRCTPISPFSTKDLEEVRRKLLEMIDAGQSQQAVEVVIELLANMRQDNTALTARLHHALRQLYGRKGEKVSVDQLALAFAQLGNDVPETASQVVSEAQAESNNCEQPAAGNAAEQSCSSEQDAPSPKNPNVEQPAGKPNRIKGHKGRAPLPAHLPREIQLIEVPQAERICPNCHVEKTTIGYKQSEILEFVPAHFKVIEEKREKVACPICQSGVVAAPSEKVMDRGRPGPGTLAAVVVQKGQDSLPLYRQESIFERSGVHISDSTLGDWFVFAVEVIAPIAKLIADQVFASYVINVDDTGLRVLDKTHPKGVKRGHIWGFVGDGRSVAFRFAPNWKADYPAQFLKDFKGFIQSDGYAGYDSSVGPPRAEQPVIDPERRLGCAMHIRRKFESALDAGDARGAIAIAYFRRIYEIEAECKEKRLSAEQRHEVRQERSMPIVNELFKWIQDIHPGLIPGSQLREATRYALRQRTFFERCFSDGRFEIDNGAIEREFKRVRLGEKNYLFAGSDAGAERLAIAYTVLATCAAHHVEPLAYLTDVITKLQGGWLKSRLAELTPDAWLKTIAVPAASAPLDKTTPAD